MCTTMQSESSRTYGPLQTARLKARNALQHLNNCREHVKEMLSRSMESEENRNSLVFRGLVFTAKQAEFKAQGAYIDAHAALYDAQLDAGMSDAQIDRMRDLLNDNAREG